jgi:hypothetical protein
MPPTLEENGRALDISQVLIQGDLSRLTPEQKTAYYLRVCESLTLNPYTKPFGYLKFQDGGEQLYTLKNATDQLRGIHHVSIVALDRQRDGDMITVTAEARLPDGRTDFAIGAVPVKGLFGNALANALMKCETKAKRRVTLSLVGLGWTDESEIETIPGAVVIDGPVLPAAPAEAYVPTREQDADDRDVVRSADERIWKRWLELLAQAQGLGLNPVTVRLPVERNELKTRGAELVEAITERQEQLDQEEASRTVDRVHAAAERRDQDLDAIEVARQKASGEL